MKTIPIAKAVYDELMAITEWYEAMPGANFAPGDHFHENVFEFQSNCLKDPADLVKGQYLSHFELQGDKLIVAYGNDEILEEGVDLYTYYEIVPSTTEE